MVAAPETLLFKGARGGAIAAKGATGTVEGLASAASVMLGNPEALAATMGPRATVLSSSRMGAATGVAEFDAVFAQSPQAARMMAALEGRGVTFIDDAATLARAGDIAQTRFGAGGGLEIVYDSASTRFIDILHEARHVAQIQRAQATGLLGNRNIFGETFRPAYEWGAYSYELRLGASQIATNGGGFSNAYRAEIQGMLLDYPRPRLYGGTNAAIIQAIEPRLR